MNAPLRRIVLSLSLIIGLVFNLMAQQQKGEYVLVIHGGAGTILKSQMTPEREQEYKAKLPEALQAG